MKDKSLVPTVKCLVCFDNAEVTNEAIEMCAKKGIKLYSLQAVAEAGKNDPNPQPWNKCTENDCPLFSYTSGTTGDSKGVKLTHKNVLSAAYTIIPHARINEDDAQISYLPYPHSFEQVMVFYSAVLGTKIGYYNGDPARISYDCQALGPAIFPSVPRLFNRIYSGITDKVGKMKGATGWLARKAIEDKKWYANRTGAVTHCCYDKIVFKKFRQMLGGQVKFMITGSAPIDKAVLELLKVCFCCPFLEGYGLTESSAGSAVTLPRDPVMGHVGGPLPCVKWRLKDVESMNYKASDKPYPRGELLMKGPSITSGYYKRPDKNAEAFDKDGWFMTGDVVQVYPNGSVKIIDRSKNIFKLAQGEYIMPEKIENVFALCPLVAQSFLYGDSLKPACVAVIVPDMGKVKAYAREKSKIFPENTLNLL